MSRPRPLRVLHVHHTRAAGGAPVSLARLVGGLDRRRFESRIVVPGPGEAATLLGALDVPLHVLPVAVYYYLAHQPRVTWRTRVQHTLRAPWNRRGLRDLFRAWRPDVVHVNTALIPVSAAAASAAGIPVLWHVREVVTGEDPRAMGFLLEAARKYSTRMVAISEAAAAPFRAAGPVRVVPEAVDLEAWWQPGARDAMRQAQGAARDDLVLLFPGMFLPGKGQAALVALLPRLFRMLPRLSVWFAGGPSQPDYARRIRRAAGPFEAAGRVRWIDWGGEMPGLMAAADIVVTLPQQAEGFGLPLVEAMAAGRALLTVDIGPAREIVASDEVGLLVPPADDEALLAGLTALALDPERRGRMGEAARRQARARFGLTTMVGAFESLFDEAAAARKPPA